MKKVLFFLAIAYCCQLFAQSPEQDKQEKRRVDYFNQRMEQVPDGTNLSDAQKQEIKSVFLDLCKTSAEKGQKLLYRIAVNRIVKDTSLYYPIFKTELDPAIHRQYESAMNDLKIRFSLNENQLKAVSKQIHERSRLLQLGYFLYPENEEVKIANEKKIKAKYRKRTTIILTKQGVKTDLFAYCPYLAFKKELGLTPEQIHLIILSSWDLMKQKQKKPNFDIKKEIHLLAKEIMTETQYDKYLSHKVASKTYNEIDKTWKQMKELNITADIDSTLAYRQLLSFYLERNKIQERYDIIPDSDTEKEAQLVSLKSIQPEILKKFRAFKKLEKEKNKQDNNSLAW